MSHDKQSFVEQCLAGHVAENVIDDFIDRWHAGEGTGTLSDFLGFTAAEYAAWVEKPHSLTQILEIHRRTEERATIGNTGST